MRHMDKVIQQPSADKTVQVRVKPRRIVDGYSDGTVFFTTPARARMFKDQDAVDIIGGDGNTIVDTAPEAGSAEAGKSCATQPSGPTTDSASSSQSGPDSQLSSSAEDQASASNSAPTSQQSVPPTGAESSPSTTATNAAPPQTSSTSQTTAGGSGTRTGQNSRTTRR